MEPSALGKKVFFLYPPPVLSEVLQELINKEFEVYLAKDHVRLRRVLAKSPDAIVFLDLDEGLDEAGWEAYVRGLRADPITAGVGIGVLTLTDDVALREKYLMDIQVQCGFVILKIGAAKTAEILVRTLDANEARGRRKFVRAACGPGIVLKVILETCLLNDEEKVLVCRIAAEEKADFVKTSTGFSKGGATVEDVALMRRTVGPSMGVKASGGVRSYDDAAAMIKAGATRIGASSSVAIVSGAQGVSGY